jgi:phenylacetate-CoA ligase
MGVIHYIKYIKPQKIYSRRLFLQWHGFVEKSQWWTKEELFNYQWDKIKLLLIYVYKNVPYYQQMFKDLQAAPDDIKTLADFKKLPFLTKEIIKSRIQDFLPNNYIKNKNKFKFFTTSGSTGQPLGFYLHSINDIIENAFMYQQWKRVGFKENRVMVILRGEPIKNNDLFIRQRFSNTWYFSSFQLSKNNIKIYVDKLNQLRPEFMHVYPSSLNVLTRLLLDAGLKLTFSPIAILCGSEALNDYQRDLFQKTFNTRIYRWLGSAEQSTLAGECEGSFNLHAWPQYSFVELLDEEGSEVNELGKAGEIIGTNLHNYATPFIRYKSGDLATYAGNSCRKCGRQFLLFDSIKGRIQDFVYLNDCSTFPIGPAIFGIHEGYWSVINRIQIIQNIPGEIIIKIDSKSDKELLNSKLQALFYARFGKFLKFSLEFSSEMEKTKNGKHILLIQNVKLKH